MGGFSVLEEQVIVVTGGAGLLGESICHHIAREGGTPIVADLDFDRAEQVAREIQASKLIAQAVSLDITDGAQIERVIREVQTKFGRVDAVVNNAYPQGKNYGRTLEKVKYEDFCESLSLHLGGYFLTSQKFASVFKSQGHGNIVNIASIYGLFAPRFELYEGTSMTMPVEYAAIKAGIINLTRYFAQYYLLDGVRCNALAPGGIRDNQPAEFTTKYDAMCGTKGLLDAADLMGALTFLLSDASKFMTGQVLVVDDGWSL
jgi:NAD(P)-dependent dehydrogenase (short-subunit alcohol dehydrogenase family)